MFEVSQQDKASEANAELRMTYELQFNNIEYKKFEKRLKNLLAKVAIAETSGQGTYDEIHADGYSSQGPLHHFNKSDKSKEWPEGTKTIAFCNEFMNGDQKKWEYHCYAVPTQIYERIDELTSDFGVLVFEFAIKGMEKPNKRCIQPELSFFLEGSYGGRATIEFRNWMGAYISGNDRAYFTKKEYTKTWNFSEDVLRQMETCTIKVYTGQQAKYLWYSYRGAEYEMRSLAVDGYLPAMIAMVEQFEETKTWYHRASLLGSTHAQKKIGWKNGGLGFEIMPKNNGFMVWSARKGVPINRGLFLKSINDTPFKNTGDRSIEELSNYIGNLSPGTSVSVEFTNGKTIDVLVQEQ